MATKYPKRIKRHILFTDKMRRELCTNDSYWLDTQFDLDLVTSVSHNWDSPSHPPTLHKVVISLLEEAYRMGKEEGRNEIQSGLRDLIGRRH